MTPSNFPNDAIFRHMAELSANIKHPIIIDPISSIEANYDQLFQDVALLRAAILQALPPDDVDANGIIQHNDNFICVLSPGDYEFIVAFAAILSIGGAIAPLGDALELDDAAAFFDAVSSSILIASPYYTERAEAMKTKVRESSGRTISVLSPTRQDSTEVVRTELGQPSFQINENILIPLDRPVAATFTSGSTGRPKTAVCSRRRLDPMLSIESAIQAAKRTVLVSYRPPQWAGGVRSLIRPVVDGLTTFLTPPRADAAILWAYIRDYAPTAMDFVPFTLKKMQAYYETHIATLSEEETARFTENVAKMTFTCYGAMIEQKTRDFWTRLAGRNMIINLYGASESGFISVASVDDDVKSVGRLLPGVEVQLSEGDYGEARIKSQHMFLGYLNNPEANKAIFDKDGYYISGDILRRVGDEYFFEGRADSDYIAYHAYKIAMIEIETALTNLPYVAEACIVRMPDYDAKELVGAILRINSLANGDTIDLARIRADLSRTLAVYKLPVLVRYLAEVEELPRTHSEKVIKKGLLQKFFGIDALITHDYSFTGTEYLPSKGVDAAGEVQPWDWSGEVRGSE